MSDPIIPRVLFVDDDADFLAAMTRSLRSEHYLIETATSPRLGLEMVRDKGPYSVLVSDLRMAEMDGIMLLRQAREIAPDTVRILFTGQPDLDHATAAINEGAVFRFVVKPCSRVMISLTLKAALKQHQLVTAERVLLEQTLRGSIQALTDVLALASPLAFGRATRLRKTVAELASAGEVTERWHVEVAAMLSQIGCIVLPNATLERLYRGESPTPDEQGMLRRMPAIVEQLLAKIPRLEPVREILKLQYLNYDGSGASPGTATGEAIPWGARALKIAADLDALESEGLPRALAIDTLRGREGRYDPVLLAALGAVRRGEQRSDVRELRLQDLRPGMTLAQDVKTEFGSLFIARGQDVTDELIEKLLNVSGEVRGKEAIRVITGA